LAERAGDGSGDENMTQTRQFCGQILLLKESFAFVEIIAAKLNHGKAPQLRPIRFSELIEEKVEVLVSEQVNAKIHDLMGMALHYVA